MKQILIINGPNLNLLGEREPEIYGTKTLDDIEAECVEAARERAEINFTQYNDEGAIVTHLQRAREADAIIINAAAYTHTSVAIADALKMCRGFKIELHISNIFMREEFRHHSYISPVADAVMYGFGTEGYALAVQAALLKSG